MAQLEVAYQLRGHVFVIIGSEQTEPSSGWPYHLVLKSLTNDPTIDAKEVAVKIARAYLDWLRPRIPEDEGDTHSVLLAEPIEDLAQATAKLGRVLVQALRKDPDPVLAAVGAVQVYDDPHYADLGHLAFLVSRKVRTPSVKAAAATVLEALRHVVAYTGAIGADVGGSTGITVYLPNNHRELASYRARYALLAFAKDHPGWLALLDALHAVRRRLWSAARKERILLPIPIED